MTSTVKLTYNVEEESEIIEAATSVKSLKTLRANFNLKLDMEDEPDRARYIYFINLLHLHYFTPFIM